MSDYIQYDSAAELKTTPAFKAPAGAIDSHVHIFRPGRFAYAPGATYHPHTMSYAMMVERNKALGLSERFLAVGATPTGDNNATIINAFEQSQGVIRSIATVKTGVSDGMLDLMQAGGVVGLRYAWDIENEFTPPEEVIAMAERLAERSLIFALDFNGKDFATLAPHIETLAQITRVDIDHMGRPDARQGINGQDFVRMKKMLARNRGITVKISGFPYITKEGGIYNDVLPFALSLIQDYPDQVVWGTGAPHLNVLETLEKKMPGDAWLMDLIPYVTRTIAAQDKLLVTNPQRRYFTGELPVPPLLTQIYQQRYERENRPG